MLVSFKQLHSLLEFEYVHLDARDLLAAQVCNFAHLCVVFFRLQVGKPQLSFFLLDTRFVDQVHFLQNFIDRRLSVLVLLVLLEALEFFRPICFGCSVILAFLHALGSDPHFSLVN